MEIVTWIGIVFCLTQSATFSGLNLALFGVNRLRLEIERDKGNKDAARVLGLRSDANLLLCTILWGNVGVNVLLTLLSDSVMAGVAAFFFSTFGITFFGEIIPQAYFSRHALRMGSLLAPVISFYQKLFYVVAKPSAKVLDWWLGPEGIHYFREHDLRAVIRKHMAAGEADLEHREGLGALNFLSLDDIPISREGELVDPLSVIQLPLEVDLPTIPAHGTEALEAFVQAVEASGRKWVILTDDADVPRLVLDADGFLRRVRLDAGPSSPYRFCHRPVVVTDSEARIGSLLHLLRVEPENAGDDVIDHDLILLWGPEKRIVTGADLLGRLLRGIVTKVPRAGPR